MREILFRGKRIDSGEWVYGNLNYGTIEIKSIKDSYYISDFDVNPWDKKFYPVIPESVGQFTGLTDKNGKKIFEGDIIKIVPDYDYSDDYSISKVYSYNGVFCVDYHGDDFYSTALGFLDDYLFDGDFEVIGNIHDNPELLEVTK